MTKDIKVLWGALIAVAIIAIGGLLLPQAQQAPIDIVGAMGTRMPNGMTIGAEGTDTKDLGHTSSCTLIIEPAAQAGSTTQPYDCALSGVDSGDTVFAQFSTSTSIIKENAWWIVGSKASTTDGYVTVDVYNGTGATKSLSATGIASSTNVIYADPR